MAFGLIAFASFYAVVGNLIVLIPAIMAERFFLAPSWGLAVALSGLLVPAFRGLSARISRGRALGGRKDPRGRLSGRWLAGVLLALALIPLALRTWIRIADWRNDEILLAAGIRCNPRSLKLLTSLASQTEDQGRWEDARGLYQEALRIRPDSPFAKGRMGIFLLNRGQLDKAEPLLLASVRSPDPTPVTFVALATLYLRTGRLDDAFSTAGQLLQSY